MTIAAHKESLLSTIASIQADLQRYENSRTTQPAYIEGDCCFVLCCCLIWSPCIALQLFKPNTWRNTELSQKRIGTAKKAIQSLQNLSSKVEKDDFSSDTESKHSGYKKEISNILGELETERKQQDINHNKVHLLPSDAVNSTFSSKFFRSSLQRICQKWRKYLNSESMDSAALLNQTTMKL